MRLLAVSLSIILLCSCAGNKKINTTNNGLNGTWVPQAQEFSGTQLPASSFESQKLIINDSNYTVIAESVDKGTLRYSGNRIDILSKEGVNAGKHFTAIYKLENGELTICYNLKGDSYPENFDTKGKPMYFLSVFKKE